MAVSHLVAARPDLPVDEIARLLPGIETEKVGRIRDMIERSVHAPLTSSMGRLFDAASALSGVAMRSTFEGQAAMELEGADEGKSSSPYPFLLKKQDGRVIIDPAPLILAAREDRLAGASPASISGRFHAGVVEMTARVCSALSEETGLDRVVLSGGCFQNARLLEGCLSALSDRGLRVHTHALVPPNDGGIALGQAAVALARCAP